MYGVEWIVERIIKELTPFDLESAFEESHEDIYDNEVAVAWCKFHPLEIIKELDPISWRIAIDEWADQMEEGGMFFTIDEGMTYYHYREIVELANL